MPQALAGNTVNAQDIIDTVDADIALDTAIGTAATNFTATTQVARTALGGRLVYLHLIINTTNAITATSGNVSDVTMFTLDAAYRPTENINCAVGTGLVTGEAIINTDGTVQIRAASDSISAGANLRMTVMFMT